MDDIAAVHRLSSIVQRTGTDPRSAVIEMNDDKPFLLLSVVASFMLD